MSGAEAERPAVCTVATRSHAARARCMTESFLEHHPEGRAYVLRVDGGWPAWEDPRVRLVGLDELDAPALPSMRARYTVGELCNALKPYLLMHVLATTGHERLCHLDADTMVFGPLGDSVWGPLGACSVLLTPHLCAGPDAAEWIAPHELAVLTRGVYNAGLVGVSRGQEADRFLRWWASRLATHGYFRPEEGMSCDQRWLDFAPSWGLGVRVSRDPGLNAAFWNLGERRFEVSGGAHVVNGVPLGVFHFSGYSPDDPGRLTSNWTPFSFANRPDVRPVFEAYHGRLLRAEAALAAPPPAAAAAPGHTPGLPMPMPPARALDLGPALAEAPSGPWAFALRALMPLHRDGGVRVVASCERAFAAGAAPIRDPWVGFVRTPPGAPDWYPAELTAEGLAGSPSFRESLPACAGLFCVSEAHRRWLEARAGVPVACVLPPVRPGAARFSVERFMLNPAKTVVQVGTHLRRLHAIYDLPVTRLARAALGPAGEATGRLLAAERAAYALEVDEGAVERLGPVDDAAYDRLLSRNLVFLDLYAWAAGSALLGCVARGTPVLVNRLPELEALLGRDYPFFYATRGQAARYAEDLGRIEAAHAYLLESPLRGRLTPEAFVESVRTTLD